MAAEGPVRAERLLSVSSEHEAMNLDHVTPAACSHHQDGRDSSCKQQYSLFLAWRRHISLSVPHQECRDHFGKL